MLSIFKNKSPTTFGTRFSTHYSLWDGPQEVLGFIEDLLILVYIDLTLGIFKTTD